MPKDRKAPPLSSDQAKASPYCCSTKNTEKTYQKNSRNRLGTRRNGKKLYVPSAWSTLTMPSSYYVLPTRRGVALTCATRATANLTVSTNSANHLLHQQYFFALSVEGKSMGGSLSSLLGELEREKDKHGDLLSASQREWEEEGSDPMTLEGGFGDTEIEELLADHVDFRTTPRMRVGNGPWHQLASRTGGYPPRRTQNIIGQILDRLRRGSGNCNASIFCLV
ncbi:MAP kinase kinase kinase, putative [Actinidia rufa]|uniref:MAP kinase kinase kinase, putative n=1 Tax=Actinidia rufa TaxID=165716 RepID=A0A7J0FEB9_9ERIC|nr:MAP kinase kinase kinase, putative [Actinidia rufa]